MQNRWRILAVLFAARTTMAFQFQAVAALSPIMMRDFGIGLTEIGILIGIYVAPGVAFAYPGGAIGQRLGDRLSIAGGMLLMIAGGALMALGTSWETQIAGRLIAGTGGVLLNVLMSKMVLDWFAGREIATAMGIFVNSWPIGIAAALLILPPVAVWGGYAAAIALTCALVAVGLVLFLAVYVTPDTTGAPSAARTRVARPALYGVLLAGSIWALFNAAFGTVFGFGPAMLAERGWSLADASSATSVVMWMTAIATPIGGAIADRTGRRDALLVAGVLVFAAAMVTIAVSNLAVLATFVVIGIAAGMVVGPILSLPAEVLTSDNRAPGMGMFHTLFYAIAVAFPAAAGLVAEAFGSASVTFLLGAAALIMCPALLRAFRSTRPAAVITPV